MGRYHHIVLFRMRREAGAAERKAALAWLTDLGGGHEGLEEWHIHESVDTRKGHILVEEAVFTTGEDFKRFHSSERHVQAATFMHAIADWWTGDYEDPA